MFEGFASSYGERVAVINYLVEHHFYTNVMMEPFLSDPIPIVTELTPILERQDRRQDYVITIGEMNYTPQIVFNQDPNINQRMLDHLKQLYSPSNLLRIWKTVASNAHLFHKKDSILALGQIGRDVCRRMTLLTLLTYR